MEKQKFIELLFRRAEGLISMEESRQLEAWLAASPNHLEYEKKVNELLAMTEDVTKDIDLDLDLEFEHLRQRIQKEKRNQLVRRLRTGLQVAAGFAILVISLWFFAKPKEVSEIVFEQTLVDIDLADGSSLWLSEGSVVKFYNGEDARRVNLTGLAYFEVEHEAARPFIIETKQGTVTVVGTILEVDARKDEEMQVRVQEGKVLVHDPSGVDSININAGEGVIRQPQGFTKLDTSLPPIAAWRLMPMQFNSQPFGEVIPIIEERYDISFQLEDSTVSNCMLTFTFSYPPLPVLIETLETLLDIEIVSRGKGQYFIEGEGC